MAIFLRVSRRLYVWLLVLYPARLRSSFGAEMADVFAEQLSGAWKLERFSGLARVWSSAAEELVLVALPAQLSFGMLRTCALSLLSTAAVFYLILWGVTPPIYK